MFTCYLATLQNCWLTGKSAVAKMGLQGKNYDFDSDDINSYHSFPNSFWHFAGCYWDSIFVELIGSKRAGFLQKFQTRTVTRQSAEHWYHSLVISVDDADCLPHDGSSLLTYIL